MTYPNVKPASTALAAPTALTPSLDPVRSSVASASCVALLTMTDHHTAAKYDTAATLRLIRNPLWIIVIGAAWLFAIAVSVIVVAGAFANGFANGFQPFDRAPIPIEMRWRPVEMFAQETRRNLSAIEQAKS
jgi:hypothetical protein